MSEQLDAVYDYMMRKGKTLRKTRVCRMCKSNTAQFNTHANICSECYTAYAKLTKAEKRELR